MYSDPVFVEKQKKALERRYASKVKILEEGGEQSLSHSEKDLARIRAAQKRIEEGTYGVCPHCGTLIEKERLEIIPEAPLCISCASNVVRQ